MHKTSGFHHSSFTLNIIGTTKRKNIYLLEVARTLLIHKNVPKYFCSNAVLTCYLINRMSSFALESQISYSLLHSGNELFSLPLNVFGGVRFAIVIGLIGLSYTSKLFNVLS